MFQRMKNSEKIYRQIEDTNSKRGFSKIEIWKLRAQLVEWLLKLIIPACRTLLETSQRVPHRNTELQFSPSPPLLAEIFTKIMQNVHHLFLSRLLGCEI